MYTLQTSLTQSLKNLFKPDDQAVACQAQDTEKIEVLEADCQTIHNLFNKWHLELNTTKTVTNFFHLNNHESDKNLNNKINNLKLPNDKTLKYLRAYLDRALIYQKHLEESVNTLKKRSSLIQKLTGT